MDQNDIKAFWETYDKRRKFTSLKHIPSPTPDLETRTRGLSPFGTRDATAREIDEVIHAGPHGLSDREIRKLERRRGPER